MDNPPQKFRSGLILFLGSCALLFNTQTVDAHYGAFVRVEGKPNSPQQRAIRPYPSESSHILRLPGISFGGSGGLYNQERKMYLRNMNEPSFANVNAGYPADYEEKPAFVPYIGPRALTSVKAYLNHIRDNLEALHSGEFPEYDEADEEDRDDEDMGTTETFKHTSRRDVRTTGEYAPHTSDGPNKPVMSYNWRPSIADRNHGHNTRAFADPNSFVLRKEVASNYKPSWSYTNLGLGKRNTF